MSTHQPSQFSPPVPLNNQLQEWQTQQNDNFFVPQVCYVYFPEEEEILQIQPLHPAPSGPPACQVRVVDSLLWRNGQWQHGYSDTEQIYHNSLFWLQQNATALCAPSLEALEDAF